MAAAMAEATSSAVAEQNEVEDEDDDCFFESFGRISSSVSFDVRGLGSSSSDTDAEDARSSFFSAVGAPAELLRRYSFASSPLPSPPSTVDLPRDEDYGIWMGEPLSIQERRRRLLQGMGLGSTRTFGSMREVKGGIQGPQPSLSIEAVPSSDSSIPSPRTIVRSKSIAGEDARNTRISRLEQLLGSPLPSSSLIRSLSTPPSFSLSFPASGGKNYDGKIISVWRISGPRDLQTLNGEALDGDKSSPKFCTIKDLDTGKEFVIDELMEDGSWNHLCDPQTGLRLTLEEFEKSLGYSPIVRELMRRANIVPLSTSTAAAMRSRTDERRSAKPSSKKKGIGWLKNIREVASSVTALMIEREREISSSGRYASSPSTMDPSSSEWMKVRQSRKPFKELTGLYLCQEIRAHQGSIWTIKFSLDGQMLASAGEDRIIHVWQVIVCDDHASSSWISGDDAHKNSSPDRTTRLGTSPDQSIALEVRESQRFTTKILSHRKRNSVSGYVIPGTVFSLSQSPMCSFRGHLDDILDLSWSKSQHLLSSSMDKTVRLWDTSSKSCIKLFAHNDYVTCIQFNPVDDRFFISGSLDAKVRIWNIPDRQVVDWTDLPEMVTAACYTPDGQGAFVGSHKGTCHFYSTSGGKLHQKAQIEIQNKKRKSHAKKITGFQFVPGNPSEVLITSADSQIRVFDGIQLTHKFRGFRNTSSQMSASCTADGNYVICASEDSNVYVWKRDELPRGGAISAAKGKTWVTTRSHEHFHCKDVSVAIPWPPSSCTKTESPLVASWLRHHVHHSPMRSPPGPQSKFSSVITSNEDHFAGSNYPPLAKVSYYSDSCHSDSFHSDSTYSTTFSSPSPSLPSSKCNNGKSTSMIQSSTAWGLVVVTAGLGGEIKIFQNFGLPRFLNRQNNIF